MMPQDYYNQPIHPVPQVQQYRPRAQLPYDPYTRFFQENYPSKYVVIHSILIVLLSIAAIVVQIVLIINKAPLSVIGSGIWVGVFYIVAVFLAVLNSKSTWVNLYYFWFNLILI